MEIKVAKYAGFCFGVKRAVDATFALTEQNSDAKIYTVGSLIHNPIVNNTLAKKGVGIIREEHLDEDLKTAEEKSVFVIRTHGVRELHNALLVLSKLQSGEGGKK